MRSDGHCAPKSKSVPNVSVALLTFPRLIANSTPTTKRYLSRSKTDAGKMATTRTAGQRSVSSEKAHPTPSGKAHPTPSGKAHPAPNDKVHPAPNDKAHPEKAYANDKPRKVWTGVQTPAESNESIRRKVVQARSDMPQASTSRSAPSSVRRGERKTSRAEAPLQSQTGALESEPAVVSEPQRAKSASPKLTSEEEQQRAALEAEVHRQSASTPSRSIAARLALEQFDMRTRPHLPPPRREAGSSRAALAAFAIAASKKHSPKRLPARIPLSLPGSEASHAQHDVFESKPIHDNAAKRDVDPISVPKKVSSTLSKNLGARERLLGASSSVPAKKKTVLRHPAHKPSAPGTPHKTALQTLSPVPSATATSVPHTTTNTPHTTTDTPYNAAVQTSSPNATTADTPSKTFLLPLRSPAVHQAAAPSGELCFGRPSQDKENIPPSKAGEVKTTAPRFPPMSPSAALLRRGIPLMHSSKKM